MQRERGHTSLLCRVGNWATIALSVILIITCIFVFYNTIVALNFSSSSSYNDVDWDCFVIYVKEHKTDQPDKNGYDDLVELKDNPIKYRKMATEKHDAGFTVPYPFWYRGPIPLKPDGWLSLIASLIAVTASIISIVIYTRNRNNLRSQVVVLLLWGIAGGLVVGAMWAVDLTITNNGGYPPNKWTFFDRICDGVPRSWYSLAFWLVMLFWAIVIAGVVLLVKIFRSDEPDHDNTSPDEETPLLHKPPSHVLGNGAAFTHAFDLSVNK